MPLRFHTILRKCCRKESAAPTRQSHCTAMLEQCRSTCARVSAPSCGQRGYQCGKLRASISKPQHQHASPHCRIALANQLNWMSICEKDVLHQFRVGLPSQLHFYHDLSLVCNQAASLLPLPPRMIFLPWRVLKQSNFEARSAHHTRMRWALPCIVGGTNWK